MPLTKTLELRGQPQYYRQQQPDLGERLTVGVYLTFLNKDGDLGIPLPGGIVRLYKNDEDGTSQFLGSDRIDHNPRNEDVRLHVGESFDVTARKKQTDFKIVSAFVFDSSYEIVLGNAKNEDTTILVVEPIPADWTIVSESAPHVKSSSSSANWMIRVPANSHVTLTYSVRVRYL